jgi:hypothetical protein
MDATGPGGAQYISESSDMVYKFISGQWVLVEKRPPVIQTYWPQTPPEPRAGVEVQQPQGLEGPKVETATVPKVDFATDDAGNDIMVEETEVRHGKKQPPVEPLQPEQVPPFGVPQVPPTAASAAPHAPKETDTIGVMPLSEEKRAGHSPLPEQEIEEDGFTELEEIVTQQPMMVSFCNCRSALIV